MISVLVNPKPRPLTPYPYTDPIKALEDSKESRVVLDGRLAHRSAVTRAPDTRGATAGMMKHHLYFYMDAQAFDAKDTKRRSFMPISAAEYEAYTSDPKFVFKLWSTSIEGS